MSGALYLVQPFGDGSSDRPWTAPDYIAGRSSQLFVGSRLIQWLPDRVSHPRYTFLADHPHDRLPLASRRRLGNHLGVTLRARHSATALVERLWGALAPSKARLQFELWMGELGIVWAKPVVPWINTTTQTETFPTAGDFTGAIGALTWVADAGGATVDAGSPNYIRPTTANSTSRWRTTSAVDTANHTVSATCDFLQTATVAVSNRLRARSKSDGTDEGYELLATRNDTPSHARQNRRRQVGSNATLYQDTTSPGTTGVACSEKADGSSITLTIGALVDTQTDTAVTANLQWGFAQLVGTGGTVTDARILANLVCADVVSTATNTPPLVGLTGLVGSSELVGPTVLVQ